jgi:transposase
MGSSGHIDVKSLPQPKKQQGGLNMENRPLKFGAKRIFGLDLSKKTLKACRLDEDSGFEKQFIFDEKMTDEGRCHFASRLCKGDYVAMEGGSSTSFLARFLMENTEAEIFVLNPCKLHIIFESACKTDKQDCIKIAKYIRDTNPSNWCLIPVPTYEETSMRSLINSHISTKQERTRAINQLHAFFNLNGISFLKKSDLEDSNRRHSLVDHYFSQENIRGMQASLMLQDIDNIELSADCYEEMVRLALLSRPRESLIWMSIPGVGPLTALACVAYIGDGKRFSSPEQLRNYVGLVPMINQSGIRESIYGVNHYGCMPVRRNIIQAAWSVMNLSFDCKFKQRWSELKATGKKSQKIAVKVANDMLTMGWTLLKKGELYNGLEDYSYLKRKLRTYKMTAIDSSCFGECLK